VHRARRGEFVAALQRSLPAYAYIALGVVAVAVLVVLPILFGAATSLFAGKSHELYYVGVANFAAILTARGGELLASGSFYVVLAVTVLWTIVNVAFHVGFGVALGLLLSRPTMRLRGLYRVLLIVPWAVPSYVTALAWRGMFHRQFGAVTGLIHAINDVLGTSLEPIAWFARFSTAFAANVATNVWLGFPFMMVVTLGALAAVPKDVLEAAEVDGATRWQRLTRITLPMIGPTMLPAVTLGAIWTFNMFNVVFLVSGGDPDGTTDILVSEAYRWAFTRDAQYGYAAAYAVLIFLLLLGASRLSDRLVRGPRRTA
jgi:arabinogalactan oligomer/maltooligosaccharide transport system permease protein